MTQNNRPVDPSDAELVAFLDGALSPGDSTRIGRRLTDDLQLMRRLDHLKAGERPFAEAFEPLLAAAPAERLEAVLARASRAAIPRGGRSTAKWSNLAAAAVVIFAAGAGLDHMLGGRPNRPALVAPEDEGAEWRQAVANYLALYTPETLARVTLTPAAQASDLASVGSSLGLFLTPAKVALGEWPLKRAELYDYDDKPLALLAFLDPQGRPVALCITDGGAPAEVRTERRMGMTVAYWSRDGRSYMLIGHEPADTLRGLATTLQARLAGEPVRAG